MMDFNDADRQFDTDTIPNGTIVPVLMTLRPGGVSRPGQEAIDANWLTASRSSDVLYLSAEFTVLAGPFSRRKFWQNFTIHGGTVNEKGESKAWNISKSTIRAMLNSARGVKPDDESQQAIAARRISNWGDLDGLEFVVKVRVQPARDGYQASNSIGQVIEPGHKDYVQIGSGMGSGVSAAPQAPAAPAWGNGAPPAPQAPAADNVPAWAR